MTYLEKDVKPKKFYYSLHKFIKHSQDMSCNYILSKQKIISFGTLV